MGLPFLKLRKLPRIAPQPMEEKLVNASLSDHLEHHCVGELINSIEKKDIKAFRASIEALVMNCFEAEEHHQNG